jgi:hypothetical protein
MVVWYKCSYNNRVALEGAEGTLDKVGLMGVPIIHIHKIVVPMIKRVLQQERHWVELRHNFNFNSKMFSGFRYDIQVRLSEKWCYLIVHKALKMISIALTSCGMAEGADIHVHIYTVEPRKTPDVQLSQIHSVRLLFSPWCWSHETQQEGTCGQIRTPVPFDVVQWAAPVDHRCQHRLLFLRVSQSSDIRVQADNDVRLVVKIVKMVM